MAGVRKERGRLRLALWAIAAVILVAVGAVAVRFLAPISTPAFRDTAGRPLPGSIAVAERWPINGLSQSVIVRGRDASNPVLIWLHGGPGSSETPVLRVLNGDLEDRFTVVYWDQRLAGQTLDPRAPVPERLTVGEMVADLEDLVDRVRARLGQDRVVLVGHSWGTLLGVLYASRHPDKVAAYVGIGQIVDKPRAEALSYAFVLDQAQARGDAKALAELRRIGPPPYADSDELFTQRGWLKEFGGFAYRDLGTLRLMTIGIQASEANWRDLAAMDLGGELGTKLLEAEVLTLNLGRDYTRLAVPVFIVAGRHDRVTDAGLQREYFERIEAPQKTFVWFEQSGHSPQLEEPERFNRWMVATVRPLAVTPSATGPAPR